MTALVFPTALQKVTSVAFQIRNTSRSGGPSVLGTEQVVSSPSGRWWAQVTLSVGAMAWNGSAELLAFRALMGRLRGRAGEIDLPYFEGRGPTSLSTPAKFDSAVSMNAVQVPLRFPSGAAPIEGQCFTTADGRLHMVTEIISSANNVYTCRISPWLRADYAANANVNFVTPTCRMRLVSDESGLVTIESRQAFANPTLEFVEAF